MYLTLCLDDQWVKNALTPLSESSQIATMWLQKYFDAYGDKSPAQPPPRRRKAGGEIYNLPVVLFNFPVKEKDA